MRLTDPHTRRALLAASLFAQELINVIDVAVPRVTTEVTARILQSHVNAMQAVVNILRGGSTSEPAPTRDEPRPFNVRTGNKGISTYDVASMEPNEDDAGLEPEEDFSFLDEPADVVPSTALPEPSATVADKRYRVWLRSKQGVSPRFAGQRDVDAADNDDAVVKVLAAMIPLFPNHGRDAWVVDRVEELKTRNERPKWLTASPPTDDAEWDKLTKGQ